MKITRAMLELYLAAEKEDPEEYAELVEAIKFKLDMWCTEHYQSIWFPEEFCEEGVYQIIQIYGKQGAEHSIYGRFDSIEEDPKNPMFRLFWFTDPFTATNNKFSISVLRNNGDSRGFRRVATLVL